jgi:hypothetical protein
MARPSTLPSQATENAADQAQSHLPISLPPTAPTIAASSADVSLPQHALDAIEHINPLGVNHLPDFFF